MKDRDFATSWIDAENTVFEAYVEALDGISGADAFKGKDLPVASFNCWTFAIDGGNAEHTRAGDGSFCSLIAGGTFMGRFKDRETAQRVGSLIMEKHAETKNFFQVRNLQWCRFDNGGMPSITTDFLEMGTREKSKLVPVHIVTMQYIVVYNTQSEYE